MTFELSSVASQLLTASAIQRQELAIRCIKNHASNAAFTMVLNSGINLVDNSLLLKAVKAHDVRFLTCMLHAGTSANTRLLCGHWLLHLACSAAMVQLLVK
jgi:hypothetical protein